MGINMKCYINLNGKTIQYELLRKAVKNINLRVKSDGTVYVSANKSVPADVIESVLREKADFILKALEHYSELRKYAPRPKQYIDGESFKLCGHDLRLKVFEGEKNAIDCDGAFIKLTVKDAGDIELKKKTLDKWIKQSFIAVVTDICRDVYPKFEKYGVAFPQLKFRKMVSRWGSCQPARGCVTFNYALAEVPAACIEYVVVHEFTHFLHPDHSKRFYARLTAFMPDWRERKKLLQKCGAVVL